ncbi:MAG: DUF1674 domain-containing protein [Phyllobacteriaceae bacterium]|nr:DUF1674 domain-containing protein [Phyllobacteriaceae bacterium]
MVGDDITTDPDSAEARDAQVPARRFEDLPPAAQRALKEAEARRADLDRFEAEAQAERGGRGGKDPARYGDWEIKGLAIDF